MPNVIMVRDRVVQVELESKSDVEKKIEENGFA